MKLIQGIRVILHGTVIDKIKMNLGVHDIEVFKSDYNQLLKGRYPDESSFEYIYQEK